MSNVRGVSFYTEQQNDDILRQALGGIDVAAYNWFVDSSQNDVWSNGGFGFFHSNVYNGSAFKEAIERNHYVIMLKLQAYYPDAEYDRIDTYDEFLNSNCRILLLICDAHFVDIYCKDIGITQALFDRANLLQYRDVEYITDENDGRTAMNLF